MWEMFVDYFFCIASDIGTQTIKLDKMKRYKNTKPKHAQMKSFMSAQLFNSVGFFPAASMKIVTLIDSFDDFPRADEWREEVVEMPRNLIFITRYQNLKIVFLKSLMINASLSEFRAITQQKCI